MRGSVENVTWYKPVEGLMPDPVVRFSRFDATVSRYFYETSKPGQHCCLYPNPGVGNLLRLKSQISPSVTIQNPAGAAKLPSGPKTSVITKMIPVD